MNRNLIAKQVIEFNRAAFDSIFNANILLQEQFERFAKAAMDQTTWLPTETRGAIDNWTKAVKVGQQDFKKYMDDSYKKFGEIFTE